MKEMTLQEKVAIIIRNLMKTGEFKDYIEIAKGLMCLTFVSRCHPEVFADAVQTRRLHSFKAIPWSSFTLPPVDFDVIQSDDSLNLLIEGLLSVNLNTRADHLAFANHLLYHLTTVSGKENGMLVPTKPEVARLIAFIAKEIGIDSVFDPFAAVPSYAVAPEFEGITFEGYEMSPNAAALGNLLLAIHERKMSIKTENFLREADKTCFSEGLISIPPFNMSIKDIVDSPTSAKFADEFLIQRFLEDGDSMKAIIIVPMRFAFSDGSEWLRSCLIDRDAIDMVISLPQGLLNGTNIPSLMLVLDREKPEERKDKITFMSLLDCIVPNGKNSVTIDLEMAKKKISSRAGMFVVTEDAEGVNDYFIDLNPGKYLTKLCAQETSNGVHVAPLSALLHTLKKDIKRVKLGEIISVIGLKDLASQYNFTPLGGTPESKTTTRYFEIDKNAVIIGATSDSFKVGKYRYDGQPLRISDRLIACRLEFQGEEDYVLLGLTKSYVSEQIKLLNLAMPNADIDYFLNYIYIIFSSDSKKNNN